MSSSPTSITVVATEPAQPLPRTPTLESQIGPPRHVRRLRRWIRAVFPEGESSNDPADKALENCADKRLRSDYRQFKHRKVSDLSGLLLYWSYPRLESDKDITDSNNFTTYVQAIEPILARSPSGGLRLIVLSKMLPTSLQRGLFAPSHKILATIRGRLRYLPLAPVSVITFLVSQTMGVPDAHLKSSSVARLQNLEQRPPRLPSHGTSKGNINPLQEDNHVLLTWQSQPPIFITDLNIYIWEKHKSLPESSYVDMRLYSEELSGHTKLIIQFCDSPSMLLFSKYREASKVYQPSVRARNQVLFPISEVVFSVCAGFQVMIEQTASFVHSSFSQISNMTLKARQNPTTDKIWYLVHFEDCCVSANDGISHGLEVLNSVRNWVELQNQPDPLWDAGESFESRFLTIQRDLEYLQKEIDMTRSRITGLKVIIREHLDLNHSQRNWIITIIAAIYIPLSFATSFFGMDIDNSIKSQAESFSSWMNSTIDYTSADTGNQTQALVSAIATSGPLSYSWKAFGITAGCLLITLPLSLTIGGIARRTVRYVTYYVAYWRILTIIPSACFVFCSIFGNEDFVSSLTLFYIMCNGLLIAFLTGRNFLAWKDRHRLPFWSSMLAITAVFWTVDYFTPYFPMMVFPWLCFSYDWFRPWWRRRQQYKRRTS